jgi:hypothetical protein
MAVLPHSFLDLPAYAERNVLTSRFGLPIDRAPFYGRKSRRSRQTVSFDLLACLRKGTGVRRNILRQNIG